MKASWGFNKPEKEKEINIYIYIKSTNQCCTAVCIHGGCTLLSNLGRNKSVCVCGGGGGGGAGG